MVEEPAQVADTKIVDPSSVEALHVKLGRLARATDPRTIAALSTQLLEDLRALQQDVSAARDTAVLELHSSGQSLHDIARGAGLTRGRVFQIVQRSRLDREFDAVPDPILTPGSER